MKIRNELLLHGYDYEFIQLTKDKYLLYSEKDFLYVKEKELESFSVSYFPLMHKLPWRDAHFNNMHIENLPTLKPFEGKKIRSLSFSGNQITDISNFSDFENGSINKLYLYDNPISDLTPLLKTNLPCLRILDLDNVNLSNSNLESILHLDFPNLQELYLTTTKDTDSKLLQELESKYAKILILSSR